MANRQTIQILRGSATYDPLVSQEVLADGQPFYSKKTKQLYIGNGQSPISQLKGTEIGLNLVNGEATDSLVQITNNNYGPNGTALINEATGPDGSVAFGVGNKAKGYSAFVVGQVNTAGETASGTFVSGNNNRINGAYSGIIGQNNRNAGWGSFITGLANHINWNPENNTQMQPASPDVGSGNIIGGKYNKISFGNHNILSGEENIIRGNISHNNIVNGKLNQLNKINFTIINGENQSITNSNKILSLGGGNNIKNSYDSIVIGDSNTVSGGSKFIFGSSNTAGEQYSNVTLLGNSLTALSNNQLILGEKNSLDKNGYFIISNHSQGTTYTIQGSGATWQRGDLDVEGTAHLNGEVYVNQRLFAQKDLSVGWTLTTTAFNAGGGNFIIRDGNTNIKGTCSVETAPVKDNDVVRLIDLKQVSENLVYVTDADIDALWA